MTNFAYFTGANRVQDVVIAATMLNSARSIGVDEDFHLFAPITADGFIFHHIESNTPWRSHMAKLDLLRQFTDATYDYLVWLDTDNYFTRHPGDLSTLIRQNKCWVSSEGEITSGLQRQKDWWGMPFPQIIDLMRGQGCGERIWNTNGGMFIVRRDAISEFSDKCEAVYAALSPGRHFSDEPPLAIACQSLIADPERNTIEHSGDTWAIDWGGRIYHNRLPDGRPWLYEDWLTGIQQTINPAIVHAMGSKEAMRRAGQPGPEPVGTILGAIFSELGIRKPSGCSCDSWIRKMDEWGIRGCLENRREILHRLAEASDTASWLDMANVVSKGYFSTAGLLDEAVKRARVGANKS